MDTDKLVQERGATYGHPLEDFSRVAHIKVVLQDCPDPVLRHVLEMIAVKMARLCHSPTHRDSWDDIAGYAKTAHMVMDKREGTQPDLEDLLERARGVNIERIPIDDGSTTEGAG